MYSVLHSFNTWLYYSLLPPVHSKELTQYSKIEYCLILFIGVCFFAHSKDNEDAYYLGFNTELGWNSGINRYVLCNMSSTMAECSGLLISAKNTHHNEILETLIII